MNQTRRSLSHTTALYLNFRRILQKFDQNNIPFTGVAGTDLVCWNLNPLLSLQGLFRSPLPFLRFEDGAKLLGRLEQQFTLLQHCEEEHLDSLSQWSLLCRTHAIPSSFNSIKHTTTNHQSWPVQGCLAGMSLFQDQINAFTNPLGFSDDEDNEEEEDDDQSITSVDDLANHVYTKEPTLFDTIKQHNNNTSSSSSSSSSSITADQQHIKDAIDVVIHTLYSDIKFKYEPFEWIYDGFKPILLSDVIKRKKGCPAALAMLTTAVGEKLGLGFMPMPAEAIEAGGEGMNNTMNNTMIYNSNNSNNSNGDSLSSSSVFDNLRPELALKLSTRAQSVAPGPGNWVLATTTTTTHNNNNNNNIDEIYINTANGVLMERSAILDMYPSLSKLETQSTDDDSNHDDGMFIQRWKERSVLRTWQGLCRIAIQAHQRRGESDFVAHWMYVMLALDPEAAEWGRALSSPEVDVA